MSEQLPASAQQGCLAHPSLAATQPAHWDWQPSMRVCSKACAGGGYGRACDDSLSESAGNHQWYQCTPAPGLESDSSSAPYRDSTLGHPVVACAPARTVQPPTPHEPHTSHSMHSQPGQAARQPPTAVAYAHTSRRVAHMLQKRGRMPAVCHAVAGSTRYKTTNHAPVIVARSTSRQRQERSVSATTCVCRPQGQGTSWAITTP